ncbi:MAG TPA: hypothetical protein EYM98_11020 [Dehalococcoidia bacterium]|nr:hypothetical protein [Dehalococcoidia bacterium]
MRNYQTFFNGGIVTMMEAKITVYGAPWCLDCARSKQFLGEQRVLYNWVDIGQDEA